MDTWLIPTEAENIEDEHIIEQAALSTAFGIVDSWTCRCHCYGSSRCCYSPSSTCTCTNVCTCACTIAARDDLQPRR
jgi:hypothetical protein